MESVTGGWACASSIQWNGDLWRYDQIAHSNSQPWKCHSGMEWPRGVVTSAGDIHKRWSITDWVELAQNRLDLPKCLEVVGKLENGIPREEVEENWVLIGVSFIYFGYLNVSMQLLKYRVEEEKLPVWVDLMLRESRKRIKASIGIAMDFEMGSEWEDEDGHKDRWTDGQAGRWRSMEGTGWAWELVRFGVRNKSHLIDGHWRVLSWTHLGIWNGESCAV